MNEGDAHDFERITTWLESDLGGTVTRIERQARWRPAWWVDLERDDEQLALCVRGDRWTRPPPSRSITSARSGPSCQSGESAWHGSTAGMTATQRPMSWIG
jgi:hypothetical protein